LPGEWEELRRQEEERRKEAQQKMGEYFKQMTSDIRAREERKREKEFKKQQSIERAR